MDPMESTETQELPKGTDIQELFKATGSSLLTFEHKGKRWSFRYRSISWQEHFQLIEANYTTVKKVDPVTGSVKEEVGFDTHRYYEDLFMLAIEEGPGGQAVTRPILRQLDSAIVQKLVSVLPGPKLQDDLYEVKKV